MAGCGDEETLFAFIVEFSCKASVVSIVGSWDNFQQPYPLRKDNRGGHTVWRRYSDFKGIVCDGDRLRKADDSRDGCLKMGGTYWYYYQLDNDGEHCDQAAPTTRTCPFLPGQEVNVLEVPSKAGKPRLSNDSTSSLTTYTLDPSAKYRMQPGEMANSPSFGPCTRAIEARAMSPLELSSPRHSPDVGDDPAVSRPVYSAASESHPLKKRTMSSEDSSDLDSPPPAKRRWFASFRPSTLPTSFSSRRKALTSASGRYTSGDADDPVTRRPLSWSSLRSRSASWPKRAIRAAAYTQLTHDANTEPSQSSDGASQVMTFLPGSDNLSQSRQGSRPGSSMQFCWGGEDGTDFFEFFGKTGLLSNSPPSKHLAHNSEVSTGVRDSKPSFGYSDTISTRSSAFDPSSNSNDPRTEVSSSIPTTPGSWLGTKADEATASVAAFTTQRSCYNPDENTSVLTLQNVNKISDDAVSTPIGSRMKPDNLKSKRVAEWSSQVHGGASDVEQMCREMSYLSIMIT